MIQQVHYTDINIIKSQFKLNICHYWSILMVIRTHHTSVSNIFSLSLASIPSKYWSSYPNSPSVSRWAPAAGLRTNCKQVYFPGVSIVSICDLEWGIRKPIIPMSSWTLSSVVSVVGTGANNGWVMMVFVYFLLLYRKLIPDAKLCFEQCNFRIVPTTKSRSTTSISKLNCGKMLLLQSSAIARIVNCFWWFL